MMSRSPRSLFLFSKKRTATILLGCFFVATVIAPVASLNKLLFATLTIWMLADLVFSRSSDVGVMATPFGIFAIFLYGFALSLFNHSDGALALQFLMGVLILFQIHFIRRYEIDVDKLIMVSSNAMVLATLLLWSATFIPDMPMGPAILDFMRVYSLSAFSEREFFEDATISLHLGAAPILFVGFAVYAKRFCRERALADLMLAVAAALAILLSASRGIVAGAALFSMILVMLYSPRGIRIVVALLLLVTLAFAVRGMLSTSLLSVSEASNAGKLGHFKSFLEQLTVNSLIFGRGLAHWYYSIGAEGMKAETEISPMDMVRYFGLLLTVLLYFFIVIPVRRIKCYTGDNFLDVVIFVIYLILSFTNPILFNSMGMLVILWYWSRIYAAYPARPVVPSQPVQQ